MLGRTAEGRRLAPIVSGGELGSSKDQGINALAGLFGRTGVILLNMQNL